MFLYSNEADIRKLFMFLVEKLPKESSESASEPLGKRKLILYFIFQCILYFHFPELVFKVEIRYLILYYKLDRVCILIMIGLQVHKNDMSDMIDCLQVVRIYRFMKEIKLYVRASYIVFLFVKTENNFIKEVNMFTVL